MKQKNVILMVVAVGCGLVAAFLTSQMSGKTVEQAEVVVAAKDLPVGTMLTRDELKTFVKIKKVPKDGLPPAFVSNPEELVDKRLSRPVRAEETFNPQDLSKGGAITLPEGYHMVSLPLGVGQAAAGFVGPGSRVDVLATIRLNNRLNAFKLLVNMLVVAVDTQTTYSKDGTFPSMNMVSFAVKDKEALLLSLAKSRGCALELMLRHPGSTNESDKAYKIDDVIKLMSDDSNKADVKGPTGEGKTEPTAPVAPVETPKAPEAAPAPTIATVKVLAATRDIGPNTQITNDLLKEAFEWKDLPKDYANDAMLDTADALGKAFKTGVSKGQWVTWSMVGLPAPKPAPQDPFVVPKLPDAAPTPNTPSVAKPALRKTHDVAVHGATGTLIHRYEEVSPGQWKKVAELTPEQAAQADKPEPAKPAPAAPDARKLD